MVSLMSLWLPILLASVAVFVVSSILHTVLPWHRHDFGPVPEEERVMEELRRVGLAPGEYVVPHAGSMAEMKDPAYVERVKRGPVAFITVRSNDLGMGQSLLLWFLYTVAVGVVAGYVTGRALPPGADYLQAFRFAGATSLAGYSFALAQQSIWYGRRWTNTVKSMIDGLIYALITAGMFGWLWPGA